MFTSQLPVPGIEPVPPAVEAGVVTTTPPALSKIDLEITVKETKSYSSGVVESRCHGCHRHWRGTTKTDGAWVINILG